MDIRLLGPLQVTIDGRSVQVPARQRSILAMLALQPNRPVSADRLIDGLWGDDAPATATKTLQSHVSLLRRQLGSNGEPDSSPITTEPNGYSLRIDPLAIDTQRFEDGLDRGRQMSGPEPLAARDALRDALALWQGPALADFTYEPFAEPEIRRLEELRLQAVEQLAEVRLALGENDLVVGELRRALVEAPYREQLWASLMIALTRSGRSAEALVAYRELEARLKEDLDAEPGPDLRVLETRIRNGDRSLLEAGANPVAQPSAPAIPLPSRGTRWRPRALPAAAAVGAVGIVLIGVFVLLGTRQPAPGGAVDPSANAGLPGLGASLSPSDAITLKEQKLLEQLPGAVSKMCVPEARSEAALGNMASLWCDLLPAAEADEVWFDRFSDLDLLNTTFNDIAQRSSAPAGSCSETTARAVGVWAVPDVHEGRLLCYGADGSVWIVWTYKEDRVLARARRVGSDSVDLWRWWRETARFLR